MSFREQIDILVNLQEIDSEIQEMRRLLGGVAQKTENLDTELASREAIFREDEASMSELKKKYRALEADVNANIPKIDKSKGRLSSVKTNKEYQSLLKEIEDLRTINSGLEDQMLECLEQIDGVQGRLKENENRLQVFKEDVENEKERIHGEADAARDKLERLQKEWQAVCDTIDPGLMMRFERVRQQVGNYTIARVVNAVCEGCNTNIPPQMYNELQRREEMIICPHCQRIIYTNPV